MTRKQKMALLATLLALAGFSFVDLPGLLPPPPPLDDPITRAYASDYGSIQPGDTSCFTIQLNTSTVTDTTRYLELPCSSNVTTANFSITGSRGVYSEKLDSANLMIHLNYTNGYCGQYGYIGMGNASAKRNASTWHMIIQNATSAPTYPEWTITSVQWCGYVWEMEETGESTPNGTKNYSVFEVTEYFERNNTLPSGSTDVNWTHRDGPSTNWSTPGGTHNSTPFFNFSLHKFDDRRTWFHINLTVDQFARLRNGSLYGILITQIPDSVVTGNFMSINENTYFNITYQTDYPQNVTVQFAGTSVYTTDESNSTKYFTNKSVVQNSLSKYAAGNCTITISIAGTYGNLTFCAVNTTYVPWPLTLTSPADGTIIWDRTPLLTFNLTADEEVLLYLDERAVQNLTTVNNYSSELPLLNAGNHSLALYFNNSYYNITFTINSYGKIQPEDDTCFQIEFNETSSNASNYLYLPCSSEATAANFSITPANPVYEENGSSYLMTGSWCDSGKIYDNNLGTQAYCCGGTTCEMLVNYTRADYASDTIVIYEVKDEGGLVNLTVPSACLSSDTWQFNVTTWYVEEETVWYCWDGTGWIVMRNDTTQCWVYEEGLWHYYSPSDVEISIGGISSWSSSLVNSSTNFSIAAGIQSNLSLGSTANCSVYLNVSSGSGNYSICSVNTTFLRWHDPMVNLSNAIPYFYFFPTHRSSKNVSAWKQNSSLGVLNVSTNWSSNCELELKLNASLANVTLRVSNTSSIVETINVSSTYQLIKHNVSSAELLWFWCDYFNPASLPLSYEVWFRCYDRD